MGSAAAFHLAGRGLRVLGIDRYRPPHALGSSHGQSRIIRQAYFEHPLYVPLVQRSYELWTELQLRSRSALMRITGGLSIGLPDSVLVSGARRSVEQHGLDHDILSAPEILRRFPALRPAADMIAVWEPRAGILFPEDCVSAHLELAQASGALLRYDEPLTRWQSDGAGVRLVTNVGEYRARQMLLTAGAWTASLVPAVPLPFTVERQVVYWFEPRASPASFLPESCPVHLWEVSPREFFYGFPDLGNGVKVAMHHGGELTHPDGVRRDVDDAEVASIRERMRRWLPDADGELRAASVCLYTNTPDEHFWIDRHPHEPRVLIASPCSGHGFKFAPAIGEIVADLVTGTAPRFDLSLFRSR